MYSDMQPWRPQNGAMSASLYKANSKPERCSETGSQREQTLVGNKGSKSKEHQEHNHNHNHNHSHNHNDDGNYHHMTLSADSTSLHNSVRGAPKIELQSTYPSIKSSPRSKTQNKTIHLTDSQKVYHSLYMYT